VNPANSDISADARASGKTRLSLLRYKFWFADSVNPFPPLLWGGDGVGVVRYGTAVPPTPSLPTSGRESPVTPPEPGLTFVGLAGSAISDAAILFALQRGNVVNNRAHSSAYNGRSETHRSSSHGHFSCAVRRDFTPAVDEFGDALGRKSSAVCRRQPAQICRGPAERPGDRPVAFAVSSVAGGTVSRIPVLPAAVSILSVARVRTPDCCER